MVLLQPGKFNGSYHRTICLSFAGRCITSQGRWLNMANKLIHREREMSVLSDEEKRKLLSLSEISIWLDTYDDIFSDFDSRPYSDRALSDDFLKEAIKMSREKTSKTRELKLLLPSSKRNEKDEAIIRKNLHTYFRIHYHELFLEMKKILRKGWLYTAIGMMMMVVAAYIEPLKGNWSYLHVAFVVVEPAGWFLVWTGLDHIFYTSRQKKDDLDFFSRMTNCEITFLSY
jgi:hypothetical protein